MKALEIRMFGGLALTLDGAPFSSIPSATACSLLAYLVTYRDRPQTRHLLAGLFWPELPDTNARRRLSQALSLAHASPPLPPTGALIPLSFLLPEAD